MVEGTQIFQRSPIPELKIAGNRSLTGPQKRTPYSLSFLTIFWDRAKKAILTFMHARIQRELSSHMQVNYSTILERE